MPAYVPALTGLRFVLAFWVILDHLSGRNMLLGKTIDALPTAFATIIESGYLAVQTFFLLSGFVLARNYAQTTWNAGSLKKFAAARFARIYPVYLLSLSVVLKFIVETMFSPAVTAGQKAGYLADYAFVLQGWKPDAHVGWNTPAWTLSCEFFFYFCFPALLGVLRNARRGSIAAWLAICTMVPVVLPHIGLPDYVKPLYHLPDFVAGIATARIFERLEHMNRARVRAAWFYWPAALAGVWFILHPRVMWSSHVDLNTAMRPLNVMLLLGFALGGGWLARLLSTAGAEYLGRISYAMYILHIPILWWFGRGVVHGGLNIIGIPAAILYISTVLGASMVAHQWVEIPANRWIRGWARTRTTPAPVNYELAVTG